MSKNHEACGKECAHVLLYCKSCKAPYCTKCGKEWKEPTSNYWNQWLGSPTVTTTPYGQQTPPVYINTNTPIPRSETLCKHEDA